MLKNVSNNGYNYGVVTKCSVSKGGMSARGSFTILVNGVEQNYSSSFGSLGMMSEDSEWVQIPVAFISEGSNLTKIIQLKDIRRGNLVALDSFRIKIGSAVIELSDEIQIYKYTSGKGYTSLSINQAREYIGHTTAVYTDKVYTSAKAIKGGMGRIIIISE